MDRLAKDGFKCEVSTLKNITRFYPYNCLVDPTKNNQYFNIAVTQNHWIFHRTKYMKSCKTSHDFFDVPKNSIKQAIESIFSNFGVPQEFRDNVAMKIRDFAADMMNNSHKDKLFMYMRVDFHVARHVSSDVYEQAVQESLEEDLPLR